MSGFPHALRSSILAGPPQTADTTPVTGAHGFRWRARGQAADPQATAGERSYAQAKYAACANDRGGALTSLKEAVAHGFDNPVVLADPTFAAVRALPAFDTIASVVTRHVKTGLPTDRR